MYSFLFDPAYITLFVLALIIFLVMFLWRKLTILEGNFFILEKRVNLMKKENRETSLAKNLERSNIVMNEIFNEAIPSDACKMVGVCSFPLSNDNNAVSVNTVPVTPVVTTSVTIVTAEAVESTGTTATTDALEETRDLNDGVKISFANNKDIDKRIEEAIDAVDIINAIDKIDVENDTVSISSEFTLSDDKFSTKKLSKMSVEKLKGLCTQLNISSEGTKAQLISRILENSK